jgi:hypothetical protein
LVLLLRGREAHGRSVEQKRLCREMGSCRRRKDSQFVQSRFANSCTTCKDSRFSKPPCPPYACPALALPLPCACCGPKKTRSKLNQSQVRVIPTVGILSDINSDILSGILSEMFVVTYYLTVSLSYLLSYSVSHKHSGLVYRTQIIAYLDLFLTF